MHIAILDVDVPVPTVYATRGLYSGIFRTLLHSAAERLNIPPSTIYTTSFDTVAGSFPPLESLRTIPRTNSTANEEEQYANPLAQPIDGILITGSGSSSYDTEKYPWITPLQSFIQTVHRGYPHVRIFGACFGHQIIARALLSASAFPSANGQNGVKGKKKEEASVKVEACPNGSEMGLAAVSLNPEFVAQFPTLCGKLPMRNQMRLQNLHGDWVAILEGKQLPAPWINIGHTELCPVHGLYYPGKVLTFQGHFEFDVFMSRETCIEFGRRNGWDAGDVERYIQGVEKARVEGQVDDEDDSKVAAEIVLLFYLNV